MKGLVGILWMAAYILKYQIIKVSDKPLQSKGTVKIEFTEHLLLRTWTAFIYIRQTLQKGRRTRRGTDCIDTRDKWLEKSAVCLPTPCKKHGRTSNKIQIATVHNIYSLTFIAEQMDVTPYSRQPSFKKEKKKLLIPLGELAWQSYIL